MTHEYFYSTRVDLFAGRQLPPDSTRVLADAEEQPKGDYDRLPNGPLAKEARLGERTRRARYGVIGAGILAAMGGSVAEAANTSRAVIGISVSGIRANTSTIVANNLHSWSASRLAGLSNREMAAIYHYSPSAYSTVYAISPTQAKRMLTTYVDPPSTGIDNTLEEIYLDFRTNPAGALTVQASVYQTAVYAARNLTIAYGTGYGIGTGIHWLIESYAPSLDNAIGATLDNIITNLENQTLTDQTVGYWESKMDVMFTTLSSREGINVGTYYDGGGDWGGWGLVDVEWTYCSEFPDTCTGGGIQNEPSTP